MTKYNKYCKALIFAILCSKGICQANVCISKMDIKKNSIHDSLKVTETPAEACVVKLDKSKKNDFDFANLLLKKENKTFVEMLEEDRNTLLILVINYLKPIESAEPQAIKERKIQLSGLYRSFDKSVQALIPTTLKKCKKIKIRVRIVDPANIHIKIGKHWHASPYLVKQTPPNCSF